MLALGIDLAADEARNLLADSICIEGPVLVGAEPAGLLRSAEQLLRQSPRQERVPPLNGLLARVADLVWEANTNLDA